MSTTTTTTTMKLSLAEKLTLLRNESTKGEAGYKLPRDDLFTKVNENLLPQSKKLGIYHSSLERDEKLTLCTTSVGPILCNVLGCNKEFNDISSYNTHYNSLHRYLCNECRRSLPTAHLLDLHLTEEHDSYFAVLEERGKAQYVCLLPECHKIMKSAQERKEHCIKEHNLPVNFRYGLLNKKNHKQNLHKNAQSREMSVEPMELDGVESVESKKKKEKIRAFSFGMPKEKMFTKGTSKAINLKELEFALPNQDE